MHIISISECAWYCKKFPNYWGGKTVLGTIFFFVFKNILKTIYLKIFNKMLVCCKLRPIVFNFPFRRNQFLPKRHFSGRLANSSELIFSFLDPFLQLVANYVLLSFRSIIIFLILLFLRCYPYKQGVGSNRNSRSIVLYSRWHLYQIHLAQFDPLRICESTGKAFRSQTFWQNDVQL